MEDQKPGKKELMLKVAEAIQDDVNKGIVRIDSSFMREINVNAGDIVEIENDRLSVAIVDRAYPGDIGLNIIRMDGILRRNAKTGIGEMIKVRKAAIKEAKKIIIAPSRKGIMIRASPQIFKQGLLGRAVVKGDMVSLGGTSRRRTTMSHSPFFDDIFNIFDENMAGFGFGDIKFIVIDAQPKGPVIISDSTEVEFRPEAVEVEEETSSFEVTYEDIGGLQEEISKIREMVELPLKHPEIFERLGIDAPKGILLHGPPGTGKTLLAKAVANETNSNFILINGPEIMSKFYGQSEANLRKKFEDAEKNAPSIIFIDEIDAIATKREETHGEVERRVVAQMLALMDGLKNRGKVVVIAASNIPNALDPALRRPGRFDREIEIGVPGKEGRLNILKIHTRNMPLIRPPKDEEDAKKVEKERVSLLKNIAEATHGFVGADLSALAKEAAMVVLRRVLPELKLNEDEAIPKEMLDKLWIAPKDFKEALKVVRPSALREVLIEAPNIKWDDVGGLEDVKQEIKEAVEWPLNHPESFRRLGVKPPKGILIYGAPGTGKTMLAKAVAKESNSNFILVKGPELLCVSADTPIFTNFCGVAAIKDFYDNISHVTDLEYKEDKLEVRKLKKPYYTYALDKNGAFVKTRIEKVHRLWVDESYNLILDNNSNLTGSKNQPLMIFRDNKIQWIKLEDIDVGDFVAYPSALQTFDKKVKLPFPEYKHIRKIDEDSQYYYAKIFSTKTITKLPKYVTPELASFLGWFVSEGSISKEGVAICNYDKRNQEEIKELFKQFVDESRIKVYKDKVVAYSTVLVKYLEEIFSQKLGSKKCYTIKCPNIITKSTKNVLVAFLRTAFKGDGCFADTKIEYASMSKHLAEGISYMLTLLGIKYKFWQRKDKIYMITISGKNEMIPFKDVIFNTKTKFDLRNEYNAQYKIPPVAGLLKKAKVMLNLKYGKELPDGSFEHVISSRRKCGLLRLRAIMKLFDKYATKDFKDSEIYTTLSTISRGNILWTRVNSKKKSKPQIMYDVETEHGSFIGGNIPLLLHNSKWVGESEKAVREVFKKARQTSPTIIFFDEIDSLAPRRGLSADSNVTERVVNQMLTEMDGLEDLNDVVIIAATNRPDMLDTALLRPGRFDRIILTPTPDEKTREEIFKVHTKDMPLKNISMKDLAAKSEGYAGADIEAVCREAAILALRKNIKAKDISMEHFDAAFEKVQPSVTKEIEKSYEELKDHFSKARAKAMEDEKPAYMG